MSTVATTNLKNAASVSNNIVLDASGNATFAGTAAMASSFLRNRIINGGFDVWQRGTSFSDPAAFTFTSDRWRVRYDGSGATRTISRQAFPLDQTDVPGDQPWFFRYDQSVAGTGGTFNGFNQNIESVRTFGGQQVTLSFYARAASNITLPLIEIEQFFGTGGSPSAPVFATVANNVSVGTSWARYTYTFTVPSLTGKTIGNDNNDCLGVVYNLPNNAAFTFDISLVQLEVGTVATPFERRQFGQELELCQRYYEIGSARLAQYSNFGTSYYINFRNNKRGAPTIAISGIQFFGLGATDAFASDLGVAGFLAGADWTSTLGYRAFFYNWAASAEL
jgi:hypothetical protein